MKASTWHTGVTVSLIFTTDTTLSFQYGGVTYETLSNT